MTEHQTNKSVAPPNGMSGGRETEPPTGFDSFLRFHDSVLVNRETYLGQGLCCVVYVREDMPTSATGALRNRFSAELQQDGSGRPLESNGSPDS